MSHPYQHVREHHIERERVHRIAGEHEPHRDYEHVYHRASGGRVHHEDEAEDRVVVKSMVKPAALMAHGAHAKHRADKAHRAKGGRVKHKGKTVVNVNVAPQAGFGGPHFMPVPSPPAAPPPVLQRPPMTPPQVAGAAAPGMPPSAAPRPGVVSAPGVVPRKRGGRAKNRGYQAGGTPYGGLGGVGYVPSMSLTPGRGPPPPPSLPSQGPALSPTDVAGLVGTFSKMRNTYGGHDYGSPQLADAARAGVESGLNFDPETGDVWRRGGGVKSRRATGGPVEPRKRGQMGPTGKGIGKGRPLASRGGNGNFSEDGPMAPHGDSGTGGAVARMQMNRRAGKHYSKTPRARRSP
jgi:hypothetical protein